MWFTSEMSKQRTAGEIQEDSNGNVASADQAVSISGQDRGQVLIETAKVNQMALLVEVLVDIRDVLTKGQQA